ncbi:MAG: hypothetical protein UX02_C0005G0013 [Candidatus Moranbacteria bacterium GW2011_GWC1_45_18]|nr:MAG: hypothetical protein UT79_C0005G0013 [Candidatus Moranbacteria bacterium GW2011_GWC2_40_12]KKT33042.1 MAG: hypothetical protein UW19_C0012G0014 [Candidatus Moranbacteria bacterium GW2011_GWF2_44_10]KKT99200.1 MAG: hypothetical protein UX02_C0005G0013 [Candidatus Moranbacteria bacterium GW2011_GWC1_45_18]OGI23786.1 MAG: hypothetical protein A2194_04230 [Candidatus Moranbacteria bacterium RIFOXYA1_FULL_44_8]OGI40203.1 MAG: hypothetical protein A2374_05450 [Candidatus Moranbacteria bacteri
MFFQKRGKDAGQSNDMPRKTKKSKKIVSGKKFQATGKKTEQDLRFNISLVYLIAMISISTYLLLFSLTNTGEAFMSSSGQISKNATVKVGPTSVNYSENNKFLNDPALEFNLAIPAQFGQWIYRVGSVKGLTDDTLANPFVKIYVDAKPSGKSASFDDRYKDVLTIRKYSSDEWDELEKGCGKGNLIYCEGAGTKINEKDGSVWAYTKSDDCSKETKASCDLVEKIVGSFQLK